MTWFSCQGGSDGVDYVELTQVQYDALSDAQKKNGKMYFITDANGDGSQFQPVIYSETEREIGVYTDGKPLYAKTFNKTVTCGSEQTTIDTNDIPNLDAIVYVEGYYANASINYYDSANYRSYTFADNTNHKLTSFVKFGSTASVNSRLTLYYTKTTDTAGSGTWTPQGVPSHHYSTNEKIVGTWIDGNTLYEKTYVFGVNDLSGGEITTSKISGDLELGDRADFGIAWIENSFLFYDDAPTNIPMVSTPLNYPKGTTYARSNIQANSGTGKLVIYMDMTYAASDYYGVRSDLMWVYTIRYTKSVSS